MSITCTLQGERNWLQHAYIYGNLLVLFRSTAVVDNMIHLMEQHSGHLEEIVGDRSYQLNVERKKLHRVLHCMLPT